MPRPAASALRRATTTASSPAAATTTAANPCTCSCRPPAPIQQRHASTHAITASTSSAAAGAPVPVVDAVHAGGFGFFSRSLPKRKPQPPPVPPSPPGSSTTTTTPLQCTSAWILHAPPQFPIDLPIPSALAYTLSAPPPPPPAPQTLPFDVRNWSPTLAAPITTTRSTSPAPLPPSSTTLIGAGGGGGARAKAIGPARCVCGRAARTGCMRCRASSSAASLAMRAQAWMPPVAGSGHELAQQEDGRQQGVLEGGTEREGPRPVKGKKGPQRRRREPNGPRDSPSARLAELLRQYSPKSLPHFRGVSVVASPSPSRHSSRKLSLAEANEAISAIQAAVSDGSFVAGLSVHEKLDLVRAVSTIARAMQPFPPLELLPSSSSSISSGSSSSSPDETKRIRMRHHAAELMRDLLTRAGLDRIDTVGDSPQSGTRSSSALLVVDAACLADDVVVLSESINVASVSPPPPLAAAVTNLFRKDSSLPDRFYDKVASRQRKRTQNAHAALALVLEALDHSPHSDASDTYSSALAALRLMHDLGAERLLDFVQPDSRSPPSREKQIAYNDVLRRKYGVILARLEPTPSRWFARRLEQGPTTSAGEDSEEDALAAVGLHLVRHLARAGSAGEAFAVWQKMAAERREGKSLRSSLTDLERLEALTSLVDGLAMDRLFADGNTLAIELEELARAVQIGEVAAGTDAPTAAEEPFVGEPHPLVPEAYRALARLAANQGRAPILDRLLARLAAVKSHSDTSVLEPAARQMRARSRRYELDKVRAIFESAELAAASPEERARLWGQLIAAHVRVNDVEGGLRTLQEMLETGLYVPLVTVNVILHGFARRGDVKRAAELFARIAEGEFPRVQPDTGSWNALIHAHVVARDPSTAEALIKEMRLSGARPDKQTWTTLLSAYVENGQWTAAFRVYRLLQSHPDPTFRPDTAVYNVMLKACILTGTPAPTVVELFRDLVARGVRPNMRTYTLVLQSVCLAGMMDIAEELFLLMDRRHGSPSRIPGMSVIEPDQFVFATLVAGYLRRGQSDKARAMLLEMNARGIRTSSIAVGIIIAARVASLQEREGHISAESMQRVIQQARDFLRDGANGEPGGLAARRRRQPVRFDRPLALGKEAVVVYSPILRSLAKQGDIAAALELFDEILDRQDPQIVPPIELYTTLMDGFRIQAAELDSPAEAEEMAQSVYSIWHQLYDSVCKRFVRLRPIHNVGEAAAAVGGPPLPKFARRVDPAQAGLLRLPLTILLDTATHLDDRSFIEETWRRLAQQGFAFDISNWNALAAWFIRDLQLEKALWITEHVLCRPADEEEADVESFDKFATELASVGRLDTVGRAPTRLWQNRQPEAPHSVDLSFLDEELISSPRDDEPGVVAPREGDEAEGTEPPSATSGDDLQATFRTAHSRSVALTTLAYRRTLESLGVALDNLTVNGTVRPEEDAETSTVADTAGTPAADGSSSLDEAQAFYRRLVREHPRTIRAIETLRAHRQRAEMDRYERSKGRY